MEIRRILLEALPPSMLAASIAVITGYMLNTTLALGEILGVLIVSPAVLGTGGDLATSFGARITTSLHSGVIEPHFRRFRMVYINFIALYLCGLLVSTVTGIVAFSISNYMEGTMTLWHFLMLSVGAGSIVYAIMLFLALCIAFISFRHGLDPDNLVAPLITTIADLIGISTIFLILNLIL